MNQKKKLKRKRRLQCRVRRRVYLFCFSFFRLHSSFGHFFSFENIFVQHFTSDTRAFGRFKTHRLFNRRQFNSIQFIKIITTVQHALCVWVWICVRPILWPKNQAACVCVLVQTNQWPFVFHYCYHVRLSSNMKKMLFPFHFWNSSIHEHTHTLTKKDQHCFCYGYYYHHHKWSHACCHLICFSFLFLYIFCSSFESCIYFIDISFVWIILLL